MEASYALAIMAKMPSPQLPYHMRDIRECTLLHHATSVDAARLLVELLPCTSLINAKQQDGFRPIHHASAVLANFLVSKGADVNARSRSGFTPLFIVDSAHTTLNLLRLGADPLISNTYYRHNPLHFTASHGLWSVVWCLLRAGADASLCGKDGYTPLGLCKVLAEKPLPSDTEAEIKALAKVKRMLEIWDECGEVEEVKNASSNGSASLHQKRFAMFEQRCSNAAQASISKNPALSLSNATNLPIELTSVILNDYVNVFMDDYVLKDDNEEGSIPLSDRRGIIRHMRRNQRSGLSSTSCSSIYHQVILYLNMLKLIVMEYYSWCLCHHHHHHQFISLFFAVAVVGLAVLVVLNQ
jgi:hypothetical protein